MSCSRFERSAERTELRSLSRLTSFPSASRCKVSGWTSAGATGPSRDSNRNQIESDLFELFGDEIPVGLGLLKLALQEIVAGSKLLIGDGESGKFFEPPAVRGSGLRGGRAGSLGGAASLPSRIGGDVPPASTGRWNF